MNVVAFFVANAKPTELVKPGLRSLDDPAIRSESFRFGHASFGNLGFDVTKAKFTTVAARIVGFVSTDARRPSARTTHAPFDGFDRIDQRQQFGDVVLVGSRQPDGKRDAVRIDREVMFRAPFASIRGVGAGLRPPKGARTLVRSTATREKSIWSASRSFSRITWAILSHTPAACQSRSRRQQVMPLPKPSSCGRSSHGMPVRSTKTMPLSACSSLRRGRPPLVDGVTTGSNGASFLYSSVLISLFLFLPMRCQTQNAGQPMTRYC